MRHRAISYIVAKPAVEFCQLADKLELTREAIETWEEIRATKTIPTEWTKDASNLTDDELRAFIIIDNNDFGDWNTEALANDWDLHELLAWGTEIPGFKIEPEKEDEPDEKEKSDAWFVQVRCDNEAHAEQVLKACINEGLDAKIKN